LEVLPPLPVPPLVVPLRPLRRRKRVRLQNPQEEEWAAMGGRWRPAAEKEEEESDEDMGFGLFD
jgi:hypothetical protein